MPASVNAGSGPLAAATAAIRKFGALNGCLYLLNVALSRLTGGRARVLRYYFIAQPLDVQIALPRKLGATFETRLGSADTEESKRFPRPDAVIRSRYGQGSVCIAAYQADSFVGFIWLVSGAYDEDDVRCRYLPEPVGQTGWDYDLYVEPKFRGGVAFARLWSSAMDYMRGRGLKWSLSRISAFSPESLAAHRRMGALWLGSAFFIHVLGIELMIGNVSPYLHVSWGDRRGPDLRLRVPPRD